MPRVARASGQGAGKVVATCGTCAGLGGGGGGSAKAHMIRLKWQRDVFGHKHPARTHELQGVLHRLDQVVVRHDKELQFLADQLPELEQAQVEALRDAHSVHCRLFARQGAERAASMPRVAGLPGRRRSVRRACHAWHVG